MLFTKKDLRKIEKREKKEYLLAQKKIRERDFDWLGRWLQKFSVEGAFFLRERREKNNWL